MRIPCLALIQCAQANPNAGSVSSWCRELGAISSSSSKVMEWESEETTKEDVTWLITTTQQEKVQESHLRVWDNWKYTSLRWTISSVTLWSYSLRTIPARLIKLTKQWIPMLPVNNDQLDILFSAKHRKSLWLRKMRGSDYNVNQRFAKVICIVTFFNQNSIKKISSWNSWH